MQLSFFHFSMNQYNLNFLLNLTENYSGKGKVRGNTIIYKNDLEGQID